ncbi:gamma-glutamylcyclotransferase [Lentibacillus jeotgali]|uniref:gamma-glutamylcyclotransferase n=1 Tax=Lentibacillus jeotgali TaxID=558169 RepID=UPI00026287FA|nr:gamma-glutamylcyclotransferase family protein [Lentibacillus jeotgali]
MPTVFVYGTLRCGGKNNYLLNDLQCICQQYFVEGSLFDSGYGYPIMKQNTSNRIWGELYDVSERQLAEIDQLEGYKENNADNLSERKVLPVYDDSGYQHDAFVYTAGNALNHAFDWISSGDWLVHTYLKQNNLLYFAYGSCMDDERFKKAGVDHHFAEVKGKGILEGFEFQFSRSTDDGGKADLVENKRGKVEGKVYRIPYDAIDYLYKREGVRSHSYRPAVVPVSINESIYQCLTFIGVRKSHETPPTKRYSTEIIRGGEGYLSEDYLRSLQNRIRLLGG